jgi:hypothetical protein
LTTGIPYKEVEKGLNEHRASTGAKLFYTDSNPASYMENVLGFTRVAVPKMPSGARMTVEEFAATHQRGRYVLAVSGHWTSCIDGVIYDTWQCTDESVIAFYKITRFEKTKVEKKYCFTVHKERINRILITVYDGNGMNSTKELCKEAAKEYVESLYEMGFFNFNEMGEYI